MNSISVFAGKGRDILLQAWRALALHRLRSLLSTLGIIFAVAAVVTMLSIAEGAKREAMEQVGRLGLDNIIVRNTMAENLLPDRRFGYMPEGLGNRDIRAIKQIPGVDKVTFAREFNAFLSELGESDVIQTLEVNQNYFAAQGLRLAEGRYISALDVQKRNQVCVLGADLAGRIESPGGNLGSIVHLDGDPCRVVGVLIYRGHDKNETMPLVLRDFDNAAFIPMHETSGATALLDQGQYLSEIVIKISDARSIGPASEAVRRVLSWNRDGVENFELVIPKELLAQAKRTQRLFNIVLGSIAGISLLVGGIGVMNIMLANVSERTREIGIRRAIGAKRRHITAQFLGEAILLTTVGGGVGVVLGSSAALGLGFFIQWPISISAWPVLMAILMSIGAGLGAGMYPAVKAADMKPVDALRHI